MAAADLMYVQGVGVTTLDDVRTACGVSKSQMYRHFTGKDALVRAVIDQVGERILERERDTLSPVSTLAGLRRWRDEMVQRNALRHGAYGCALGTLVSEVADHDDLGHRALSQLFGTWQDLLADVMRRLQANAVLAADAPVDQLAIGLLGAVQGGYVLAQAARSVTPMATSIDMALAHIESLATG